MSAFVRFGGALMATAATMFGTVMLTATTASAKLPLPDHHGESVDQPPAAPVTTVAESGLSGWYVFAIAIGVLLVIAVAALAVAHHHRLGHPGHHGHTAA